MTEACERVARSVALEKAYVHQVYQQITDAADPVSERGHAWPRVRQFLSDMEPGSLVCDVGCGSGKYLDINPTVFKLGVDRCKRLTEVAREKDNEVLKCDNLALPFRDESFDAVLSIAVVHHFATTDRRVAALRELARVLRIGGRLIITVWAMEQRHRKFESQDVLVPWHRPQHHSTPSLELASTTTTTTSEEDVPPPYHAYTQSSDSDSTRSQRTNGVRKRGRTRHKGRSIDPGRPLSTSQSSSSLSSPNETCYSFVRRALQKLAGGKRGGSGRHRPWFLDTWSTCTQHPTCPHHDPDGCENINVEDIQDLPIELRRLDEESDLPARRQTFACSARTSTSLENPMGHKSKSLTDILSANQGDMVRSRSSVPVLGASAVKETRSDAQPIELKPSGTVVTAQPKPKLVKQKHSLCEEEIEDEGGDQPTDMKDLVSRLPDFKVSVSGGGRRGGVFKQSSMNEELMSTERLREKERVRQNIQKQASLNEDFLFRRQRRFDSLRDTFFSASTAKRLQMLKNGLTNKIKSSTTGIEKVTGASFKNGFARILQGWKGEVPAQQAKPPPTPPPRPSTMEDRNGNGAVIEGERRHSKEDGSDSSKDSSLQSDTSVDSEDSFASVIFIPKPDQTSPPVNTSPTAGLPSPQPTSPKFKFHSPPSSIIKQPSLPCKYAGPTSPNFKTPKQHSLPTSPKFKYQMPPLSPSFFKSADTQLKLGFLQSTPSVEITSPSPMIEVMPVVMDESEISIDFTLPKSLESEEVEGLQTVTDTPDIADQPPVEPVREVAEPPIPSTPDIVPRKPFNTSGGGSKHSFPLVRRSESLANPGRSDLMMKPLPKLLSLELFNPETDDVDSDSSGVSSPDSISSVISVLTEELSVGSHDIQQAKPSPSEGQSTSTSTNDSDLNLSDQSISSLPNCKSPDVNISKSPELLPSKSSEILMPKSPEKSADSTSSESNRLDVRAGVVGVRSPDNLSSSSESLSKSPDTSKEERVKQKPKVPERVSSKKSDILKLKGKIQSRDVKPVSRKCDEKFVTAASEATESERMRSSSPSSSLLEAVADVANTLEGAVDAVIQSSPRARRKLLDTADAMRIVEGSYSNKEPDDDLCESIFKKCDKRRSPERIMQDEGYPDFEYCRVKNVDVEKIPLLSSFEIESESESDSSRRDRKKMESSSKGSCWSLGRSEKLHQIESHRRQKHGGTWNSSRSERKKSERSVVKIVREDFSAREEPYVSLRQRRNFRSHSLSLYNTERLQETWGGEGHEQLAQFAEKLSEKVLQDINPRTVDTEQRDDKKHHISSSLPAGLELVDDPYLIKLNEELSDLSRLTAELHERNNYLASLSDEDLSKELKRTKTNPFLTASDTDDSPNGEPQRLPCNPFLPQAESNDPFTNYGSEAFKSTSSMNFDDSFIPLEIDSPPQIRLKSTESSETSSTTQVQNVENITGNTGETDVDLSAASDKEVPNDRECFFLPTAIYRKPSIITTEITEEGELEVLEFDEPSNITRKKLSGHSAQSVESNDFDTSDSSKKDFSRGLSRDTSKMTIASSQGHSMESNDPEGSGSDSARKETGRGIPRDTSRVTIASSLGHSIESNDPDNSEWSRRETSRVTNSNISMGHSLESSDLGDVSERTGSGSDYSRRETSSAGTGAMGDSCASLGPESGSDCSKDLRYAQKMRGDRRSSSEETPRRVHLVRQQAAIHEPLDHLPKTESFEASLNGSTSQESLPSDNGGGSITFHRYYHVFREGELDQLIDKYIENLHIISSYYDHANWCVIAEKVHVWTI